MAKFFSKYKKLIIALVVIIGVAVGIFFILKASGITDINRLQEWINSFGVWAKPIFLLVQVVCTILLCFVPATSMTFITLGVVCFGATWQTFLLCFGGVLLSSVGMDLVGRFGGEKIIIKLIGKEDYDKAVDLVNVKGKVYVPFMYLLPIFPDDAICMVCGAMKMKWWVHYIEILLCRGIGVATIVFGVSILPKELIEQLKAFNWAYIGEHLWDYFVVITIIVFWVIVLFKLARYIDKKYTKHIEKKNKDKL